MRNPYVLTEKQLKKLKTCPHRKLKVLDNKYYIYMCPFYAAPCFNVDKSFCYKMKGE